MMRTMNQMMKTLTVVAVSLGTLATAQAAVSLDRTRAVFNGSEKSIALKVSNNNKELPFLAQAWLEDAQGKKITTGPLMATPPLQRLEPQAKSMVRIASTPDISKLPQDRETLFYFNLREIPPKSEKGNTLQIALQTKIKLFYRPQAIQGDRNAEWGNQLILNQTADGYRIENPTPYYITIVGLGASKAQAEDGNQFTAVMLAPKSEQTVKATTSATPWLVHVNDYGGRPAVAFQCNTGRCTAKQ